MLGLVRPTGSPTTDASLAQGQHRGPRALPRLSRLGCGVADWGRRVPPGLPRFLLAGGAISAVNWLTRFPLSLVLPFWIAVAVAYAVGMIWGFELYRRWVFPGSTLPLGAQVLRFIGVNLAGMATVIGGAAVLVALLRPTVLSPAAAEGLAHGVAIVAGAAVNYLGHRAITFARARLGPPDA